MDLFLAYASKPQKGAFKEFYHKFSANPQNNNTTIIYSVHPAR